MALTEDLDPCRSHSRFHYEAVRWYLATLHFALSFIMGFQWNLFNALFTISERALGISDQAIEYDVMIGSAILVFSAPYIAYVMDSGRFRQAMLLSSFCLCLGSWIIVLGIKNESEVMIFVGLVFNGLSGPMAMFGGATLSELWFPPHQRTQATSFLCLANYLGVGGSFLVGTMIVPESVGIAKLLDLTTALAMFTTILMFCTLMKFPSAPSNPVSCSQNFRQQLQSTDTLSQYRSLMTDSVFLRISACYGLGSGLYAGWGGSLNENLASFGLNQTASGWVGVTSVLGGFIGGVTGSILVDRRQCTLQKMALTLFGISSISCMLFIIGCYSRWSLASLIVVATVIGAGINGTVPILFELALETTFPIQNAAIGTVLTAVNGIAAVIFLIIPTGKYGVRWMNWVPFFACLSSIPVLLAGRIRCRRSEYDSQELTSNLLQQEL